MISISSQTIMLYITIGSVVFAIFSYFRNPQIKTDQRNIRFDDRLTSVEKSVVEIREKHLISVEGDLKTLNATLQSLSETVVRLSTIIDERIPKGTPGLTPPGV